MEYCLPFSVENHKILNCLFLHCNSIEMKQQQNTILGNNIFMPHIKPLTQQFKNHQNDFEMSETCRFMIYECL